MISTNPDPHERAHEIISGLPTPNYAVNFQPEFTDQKRLFCGVRDLVEMEGVTNPHEIQFFRSTVAVARTLVLLGSCHEVVDLKEPEEFKIRPILTSLELVRQSSLRDVLAIYRGLGQSTKPRSAGTETLPNGTLIPSFQGDEVNGKSVDQRQPDPVRMVNGAIQALTIRQQLRRNMRGLHIPSAHEMLLLAREIPFIRQCPENGSLNLLSADLPWIGVRTNAPKGPHVQLLSHVENSIGVKIDASSDAEHIRQLTEILDPGRDPGKLIFMVRVGLKQTVQLRTIAHAIARHNPSARVLYDMHGATKQTDNGVKIRAIPDIMAGITQLSDVLDEVGLQLDGGHFESTHLDRLECVDEVDQLPTHPGEIDPRLNPRQTLQVLNHLAQAMK